MIGRLFKGRLRRLLGQFPVVAIIGPRQVGKTTLARELAKALSQAKKSPVYLDLERNSDLTRLKDAELYLEPLADNLVVIDEIQRRPDLFPLMRALVDQKRKPGRFLILGSADLNTLRQISESLAGRIYYMELPGFLRTEIGSGMPLGRHWLRGGYPKSLLEKSDANSLQWREALIQSYLERDLPQLGFRIAAPELRRFWTMVAHNHGQPWNAMGLASSFGVSAPTVTHYRSILEQMLLVRSIYPWLANTKKRLVKAPRCYVRDSGLLHTLLGIGSREALLAHPIAGKSWEGFVIEQILGVAQRRVEVSFFRTHAGAEIDMVLHQGLNLLAAVEVKLSLAPHLTRGSHEARKDLGNPPSWVIYSGRDRYRMAPGVEAVGLDEFLSSVLPRLASLK